MIGEPVKSGGMSVVNGKGGLEIMRGGTITTTITASMTATITITITTTKQQQ